MTHGSGIYCAIISLVALSGSLSAQDAQPVRSRHVQVEYAINSEAEPLSNVQLWYTVDRGAEWELFGSDDDRRSPVEFEAPSDGLYGLFLVMTNQTGPSSAAPSSGATPHTWVLVDSTPPVVQFHSARRSDVAGRAIVQLRWSAVDPLFSARPITVEFQAGTGQWQSVNGEPLANSGQFDWVVPDSVHGSVLIRIAAQDLGGHRTLSEPLSVTVAPAGSRSSGSIPPSSPTFANATRPISTPAESNAISAATPALTGSAKARERAARLFEEAMADRDRGQYREGVTKLREAMRLDPQRTDALAEMGGLFYRLGDGDQALDAFELALAHQPNMRAALIGSAMAHTQKKDYASASERLRTVLRYNPNDAEVWMNLGDVAIYRGDESLARDCYLRASRIDPLATEVIENARKRLALMDDSASGRKNGPVNSKR